MKYCGFLLVSSMLMACQHNVSSAINSEIADSALNKELASAIKQQDFRLYATSGRVIGLPGIANEQVKTLTELCGIKFMIGTGDVIKSPEQRMQRQQKVSYMAAYNQQIHLRCQQTKK